MTIQKEIREWLASDFFRKAYPRLIWGVGNDFQMNMAYWHADGTLQFLHSKGMRILNSSVPVDPCDGCADKVIDDYGYFCDIACGKHSAYIYRLEGFNMAIESLIEVEE